MRSQWMLTALAGLALAMPLSSSAQDRKDATMADLTASYSVQQSEVQNLRDKGWSWNDVGTALAISKRSGQPLQELVAQKDSGMSWNQIADKNGFKLNEVNREAKQLARDFKRADRQAKRQDAIQGSGTGATDTGTDTTSPDRDRVPAQDVDPNTPRDPNSHGPAYPQSPEGPGSNDAATPSGNP